MPKIVKIKRSNVAGSTPTLSYGELGYNAADNKLFAGNAANSPVVVGAGGSSGGGGGSANIVEATTAAGFPATGSAGTLYRATDVSRIYFWDSSGVYVEAGTSGGGGSGGDGTDSVLRSLFIPAAPTSVTPTGGNAQATLTWSAPTVSAQTPITDYVVQFSSNSGSTWTTFSDGTSTATSATVTGLTNGTAYVFRVAAMNAVGTGSYSTASSSVTPASASGITMGNRYVGGVVGAYATWTISGAGTTGSPMVGAMRGDDASSEWRFTALASGTLSITARNVSGTDGWANWVVRTVTGSTTLASGDGTLNYVTTTASVTAGTQYAVFTALSGVDFSMSIA